MVSRKTHNRICPVCGRHSHRGMPARQSQTKRVHRLVRPGVRARAAIEAWRAKRDNEATADNA